MAQKTFIQQKKTIIDNIYNLLQAGNIVAIKQTNINCGTLQLSANGKFIQWQNFGSSANKNNKTNLIWIINTIFESKGKLPIYKIVDSTYAKVNW